MPAAEKPAAEKPVAAKPSAAEIIETVETWARAWSSKDVAAYLAFYAKDFKTPGGEPRAAWENSRRQRISAPKTITITVDSPNVNVVADDLVNITFRQGYRSDIITSSATTKMLVMVKSDGRWLIQQERAGN
jgi:murein L,D-transpeptidase YafK